ncbi:MAG TPA: AMP-binding protein [Bacteroidia bacterium]
MQHPNKVALIHKGEKLLFSQLKKKVESSLNLLDHLNVSNDAPVLMLHPLSHDLLAMVLALMGRGNPLVFVEEWTRFSDLKQCVKQTDCKYMLCNWKLNILRTFVPWASGLKRLPINANSVSEPFDLKEFDKQRSALISFSSGSSGQPKSIVRTQGNLHAQFEALSKVIVRNEQSVMCTNFAAVILLNLGLGIGTLISENIRLSNLAKSDFKGLYEELKKYSVSNLAFSPFLMRNLANIIEQKNWERLKLKQIICGGSPVYPSFVQSFESAFIVEEILLTYGSSEAEPIAHCRGEELKSNAQKNGLFIGKPVTEIECKLMDSDGTLFGPEKAFKAGEIVVSGEHVVTDYIGGKGQNNKLNIHGKTYHLCGDRAYFDENGALFLLGQSRFEDDIYENEKALYGIKGVKYITEFKGNVYLEVLSESNKAQVMDQIKTIRPSSKVICLQMPVDRRHKGKIKYAELTYSKTI